MWNKVMAGGWTGFIFGQSLCKCEILSITHHLLVKRGIAGALNGALVNVLLQSVSVSRMKQSTSAFVSFVNPLVDDASHAQLHDRIKELKGEIESLK